MPKEDLAKTQAIANHRIMWNLLHEHPSWTKPAVLILMGLEPYKIESQCFLCEYVFSTYGEHIEGGLHKCSEFCPLVWPSKSTGCETLFFDWVFADREQRSILAAQIRDLPVRGD